MSIRKFNCINGWTKTRMLEVIKGRPFEEAAYDHKLSNCVYKTEDGNKCAVGLFIPESETAAFGLRGSVFSLINHYPHIQESMPLEKDAMISLQQVHDDIMNRYKAKSQMITWVETHVID